MSRCPLPAEVAFGQILTLTKSLANAPQCYQQTGKEHFLTEITQRETSCNVMPSVVLGTSVLETLTLVSQF